ncbi:MAG: hypothetical protein BroJett007_10950 [Chloroflexota bacterium]|nr:MAG: hypothetical protein BroJett007_10950 [Chloroflexota bacterium]
MPVGELYELGEVWNSETALPNYVQEYVAAIERYPFTQLTCVRYIKSTYLLEVIFEVERPQHVPVPIEFEEHIALVIHSNDNSIPEAWALRKNFPQTLHQNLTPPNQPRSLCVFDQSRYDVIGWLTPIGFVDRVAHWLRRAAIEDLHTENQPLEPLLLTRNLLLVSRTAFLADQPNDVAWIVERIAETEDPLILRATAIPVSTLTAQVVQKFGFVMLPLAAGVSHIRIIEYLPRTLQDLHDLFSRIELDDELIEALRSLIRTAKRSVFWSQLSTRKLIILLVLPKSRTHGGDQETVETWAYLVNHTLEDLGGKYGLFSRHDGVLAELLTWDNPHDLEQVPLVPLKPIFHLDQEFAQSLSSISVRDLSVTAVGAGALGSHIILNLARQGFGKWLIIDDDYVLPHNLVRHALSPFFEGQNKAESLSNEICLLFKDADASRSVKRNFHECIDTTSNELRAIESSDLILDFSASLSVSRQVALLEGKSDRVSGFISPNGRFFILLVQNKTCVPRLDDLNAQFAAAAANDLRLEGIFTDGDTKIYYAGSCRDASVQLSQDIVAAFAAVGSNWIKQNVEHLKPGIFVWRLSLDSFATEHFTIPVYEAISQISQGWNIRVSTNVIGMMRDWREQRLPNETGGVLLGTVDILHRIIHIVDLLPSPSDSTEWPTTYIRGTANLSAQIEHRHKLSGGDLRYIGEWHSHPRGSSSQPSATDLEAHQYILDQMAAEGLPGIVLIQGDSSSPFILADFKL